MSPRDILLALLVVLVWGLNFVAIKWGVALVPPLLLTALRYIAAAIPAVFFVRRPQVKLSILVTYGIAVGVLQFGTLFVAIKLGMPAGLSSLVIQMQAFFTIGLAVLLLGERPGRAQLIGAGLALLAAGFWGVANIATKKAGKIDMLSFVVWSALVPPIPLLLASLLTEGAAADWAALSHPSWLLLGVIGFNGYAATIIGFGLWSVLLTRYPASTVVPFSLLVPVVGIISSTVILHEPLSLLEIVGSAIIFVGLLVNVLGGRFRLMPKLAA